MTEKTTIVIQEYLQAISALNSTGQPVKAVNLAEKMAASPSTVHATLSRMQRDGLVELGKKKEIRLTPEGKTQADRLARRHRLVETFLCDTLGIPWHEVHIHAHVLEHGLTDLVEEKLAEFLQDPGYCPHGTPIPGTGTSLPQDMIHLVELKQGDKFKVVIVEESLEDSSELMKYLHDKQVIPGMEHQVVERLDITQSIETQGPAGHAHVTYEIARKIGVQRLKSP